jgi:hypothetical protein
MQVTRRAGLIVYKDEGGIGQSVQQLLTSTRKFLA